MKNLLREVCDAAAKSGTEFADCRHFSSESTGIVRQDGRADKLNRGTSSGIGVRVLRNSAWGFASVSDSGRDAAMRALDTALSMADASAERADEATVAQLEPLEDTVTAQMEIDPRSVPVERKMAALQGLEEHAAAVAGDRLANSVISYSDSVQTEILCNTSGACIENNAVRTIMHASIVARDGNLLQRGRARAGEPVGFELVERTSAEDFTGRAAATAVALLSASPPPAGSFPVVFHPSITGLLAHEALGHNAEADHILSGTSIIAGKVGEKIASELVTMIDDSTIPGRWGSYKYDSEGTPGSRRVLIENGILRGYMHSLETAARLGVLPNGSARAQGYSNRPIIRMSNTYIQPGDLTFDQLIADIDDGVYLRGGEYGYVFSERGQYTCHAGEAFRIRNGKLAEHLRDVSVAGMTLETLLNIDAVANDFEMKMPGQCGKQGQGMYVDNGGPHVRVKSLVVGGRD